MVSSFSVYEELEALARAIDGAMTGSRNESLWFRAGATAMEFGSKQLDFEPGYESRVLDNVAREGAKIPPVELGTLKGALAWGREWAGRTTAWVDIALRESFSKRTEEFDVLAKKKREQVVLSGFTSKQVHLGSETHFPASSKLSLPLSYYHSLLQVEVRLRGAPLYPTTLFTDRTGAMVGLTRVAPLAIVQMKHEGF